MFACRITGNNDGQEFVRTYYESIQMDRNQFRGAARPENLKANLRDDAVVDVQIGKDGMTIFLASSAKSPLTTMKFTCGGQSGHFQVGDLDFVAELLEFPDHA